MTDEEIKRLCRWDFLRIKHARDGLDKNEQVEVAVLNKIIESDEFARQTVENTIQLVEET